MSFFGVIFLGASLQVNFRLTLKRFFLRPETTAQKGEQLETKGNTAFIPVNSEDYLIPPLSLCTDPQLESLTPRQTCIPTIGQRDV